MYYKLASNEGRSLRTGVDVRSSIKRYKDTLSLGVNFDSHGKAIINNYKRAFRDELAKAGLI